jgi:hypothetical protein
MQELKEFCQACLDVFDGTMQLADFPMKFRARSQVRARVAKARERELVIVDRKPRIPNGLIGKYRELSGCKYSTVRDKLAEVGWQNEAAMLAWCKAARERKELKKQQKLEELRKNRVRLDRQAELLAKFG